MPALVKEFNAAFGNKDGRKRIRAEYEKAESTYINEILDVEDHVSEFFSALFS